LSPYSKEFKVLTKEILRKFEKKLKKDTKHKCAEQVLKIKTKILDEIYIYDKTIRETLYDLIIKDKNETDI